MIVREQPSLTIVALATLVKVCGWRPHEGGAACTGGRRTQTFTKADIARNERHVRYVPILLQKSKIQRPQKSRKCRFLDNFAAVMLSAANKKAGDRFAAK
jgi:hypothetical protein